MLFGSLRNFTFLNRRSQTKILKHVLRKNILKWIFPYICFYKWKYAKTKSPMRISWYKVPLIQCPKTNIVIKNEQNLILNFFYLGLLKYFYMYLVIFFRWNLLQSLAIYPTYQWWLKFLRLRLHASVKCILVAKFTIRWYSDNLKLTVKTSFWELCSI